LRRRRAQAQQRYRERRKQRFIELEATLDSMSARLAQLQGVQQQNQALQEQMGELGALLRAKEAELARVHSQLAASSEGGSADTPLAFQDGTGEVRLDRLRLGLFCVHQHWLLIRAVPAFLCCGCLPR
jgi:DNA repair exonuclease SbcCD ATPase subunit